MQITVEVKLEQRRRIIRRSARIRAPRFGEAKRVQLQRGHEGVKKAHRIFSGDIILQPFREEQRLRAIQSRPMVHA